MAREKNEDRPVKGISRRDFLGRSAAGALTTGLLPHGLLGSVSPAEAAVEGIVGPDPVPMRLRVNGKSYPVELEPRVTLLDALRNHLDITGTKKVCDRATCGACTVHVDGRPAYSCTVLAIEAQEREIVTIEGLGTPDQMHPLQAAFVANDAQQCGFCTPGFVMASKAFIDQHPNPTVEDINRGLGGNLCRCGTYIGIRQAILDAARKGGVSHG